MTLTQIKKKVLAYKDWEWWAERPFGAFIMSMFAYGERRDYMKKLGVDLVWPADLYQKGAFYQSQKVLDKAEVQLRKYLKDGGTVFDISRSCEEYWVREKKNILKLNQAKLGPIEKLKELYEIFALDIAYVWLTHGFEHLYKKRLYKEVPRYFKGDIDKFIGDASYPKKKNAHHFLEEALRSKKSLALVQKEFGWIKVRDGFSDPFSIKELAGERKSLYGKKSEHFRHVVIPKQLRSLFNIAQELVYQRTLRTDALYDLMFTARPTLKEVAKHYKISFKDLIDYSMLDLIKGKPHKYPRYMTFASINGNSAFFDKPILNESYGNQSELRGLIANHGLAKGKAKIVKTAYEIGKVKNGDILFAPTTAPSFIIGMKKAAAFVTDEGGITSHAAIVSREMGKPCIIGTKIGTKMFKDGDLVEVDANKGIVRKLTK